VNIKNLKGGERIMIKSDRDNGRQSVWNDNTVAEMQIYANAAELGAYVKTLPRQLLRRGFTLKQIKGFRDSVRDVGFRAAETTLQYNIDQAIDGEVKVGDSFIIAAAGALGEPSANVFNRISAARGQRFYDSVIAVENELAAKRAAVLNQTNP
jgi:hypothetical protein